jgi:branched-chain amino acid transport system ATP-binding protein
MGLAPIMVEKIFSTISEVTKEGVAVLLVEQNAKAALALAQRAYVMESGVISLEGNAKDLAADPRVRAAYLGE